MKLLERKLGREQRCLLRGDKMKRVWTITIETASDGKVSVHASAIEPDGNLSPLERKLLCDVLETGLVAWRKQVAESKE